LDSLFHVQAIENTHCIWTC